MVDLDAALGQGANAALVEELVDLAAAASAAASATSRPRSPGSTGARPRSCWAPPRGRRSAELPGPRVIAALDARDGEVVVEGWQKRTGRRVLERMRSCASWSAAFW